MNITADSSTVGTPIAREQEMRRFMGEALREGIRWSEHPAWTVHALRERDGETQRVGVIPPPAFTAEEIRSLIAGPGHCDPCPRCGYVAVDER